MKSCVGYYGGKYKMLPHILPLIPPHHECYVEPFFGGGSVYFAKPLAKINCINDTNRDMITFWEVMKEPKLFKKFQLRLEYYLHSQWMFKQARKVLETVRTFNWREKLCGVDNDWKVDKALAVFTILNQGMFGDLSSNTWRLIKNPNSARPSLLRNLASDFEGIHRKLKNTYIACDDAVRIINIYKTEPTCFIYCDPPYPNSNMGHYSDYNFNEYQKLLVALSDAQCKWLLSSYMSDMLMTYGTKFKWHYKEVKQQKSVVSLAKQKGLCKDDMKTEVLISNYEI